MEERAHALAQIVEIARGHGLTAEEVAAALGESAGPGEVGGARGVLVKVLGFLGGTFVFAGIGVFVALQWDDMNAGARVIVTLGSGLAAFVLALAARTDVRFEKATTPLLLIAAALEPTGMLVTFSEFSAGGDWHYAGMTTAGTIATQFLLAFLPVRRSTLLFIVIVFGVLFALTTFDLFGVDETLVALTLGGALMLASLAIDRTPHGEITPPWYLLGGSLFLYGLFDVVDGSPLEVVFVAAACGFVYLSVLVRSRTLLFVGTLAILAYTGYFTGEHFAESIGWPLALIAFGLFMIGLSALAVRIDRDYLRGDQAR